jgi:hypothetical protein
VIRLANRLLNHVRARTAGQWVLRRSPQDRASRWG